MKKIILLVSLLLLLGGIVIAQTFQGTPTAQPVPEDIAQSAKTTVQAFLDAVSARNTRRAIELSAFETKDAARSGVALAIGGSRNGTFDLQGIDFDGPNQDRLVLIGFFPSGKFLKAVVAKTDGGYKVVSIAEP